MNPSVIGTPYYQANSCLSLFPTEIQVHMMRFLDKKNLFAYINTCKQVYKIGLPILLANILPQFLPSVNQFIVSLKTEVTNIQENIEDENKKDISLLPVGLFYSTETTNQENVFKNIKQITSKFDKMTSFINQCLYLLRQIDSEKNKQVIHETLRELASLNIVCHNLLNQQRKMVSQPNGIYECIIY